MLIRKAVRLVICICSVVSLAACGGGCADPVCGPAVFYCDGAGWYSSAAPVAQGLRDAGYKGTFNTYGWSALLGAPHDHFVTAHSKGVARGLARRIEKLRRSDPQGQIDVMGLSAGTAVVLNALEELPAGIEVNNVVLFSPSVSSEHDLSKAMQHVRRNLYATCSPHDAILATLAVNADGEPGPPAGRVGLRLPRQPAAATESAYRRVINLPWEPAYLAFDWNGAHTGVTNRKMVAGVIAPRVLATEPYPLDRSVMDRVALRTGGS
jgi:pimeloyl-ACP methyl ester carboxylesterase